MKKIISGLHKPAMALAVVFFLSTAAWCAEKQKEPAKPYDKAEALGSIINPHDMISDEGDILWGKCSICHTATPDIKKDRAKDVSLRFEEDPKLLCNNCHSMPSHPGTDGPSVMMSGFAAPEHMIEPPKKFLTHMRLAMKDVPTILPLDKSGRIYCATCHNPHERGLLIGRADYGADARQRLRSAGLDVCQYCHRK